MQCQTGVGRNAVRRSLLLAGVWVAVLVALACAVLGIAAEDHTGEHSVYGAPYIYWFLNDG